MSSEVTNVDEGMVYVLMIKITKQMLRSWQVSAGIYRWFLCHFPDGGDYAQIHSALVKAGYIEWANSLLEYAYSLWSENSEFAHQEVNVTQGIIDSLNNRQSVKSSSLLNTALINSASYLFNRQPCAQLSCATDHTEVCSEGYCSKISNSGMSNLIASSGEYSWIASAGYACQIASSGNASRICNAGQNSRIGSSGERSRISSSGNSAKISSSGQGSRVASTGMRSRIGSISERGKIANAGDLCKISSFGDNSLIANTGTDTGITALGNNSVIVSAGPVTYIVLGKGGCASIPYHDGRRIRFATAYEGESGIRAGVKYKLNDEHLFVEFNDDNVLAYASHV